MCVKVLLADDAEVMRRAIRMLLSGRDDIAVVGETSNFRETIQESGHHKRDLLPTTSVSVEFDCAMRRHASRFSDFL
jgi:DNA-binding NarL/FixJ family response regulator